MNNLIIVPAKGDSKRFPKKNWKTIGGKTLIELAVERALKSELGPIVLVSDDLSIKKYMIAKASYNFFLSSFPQKMLRKGQLILVYMR